MDRSQEAWLKVSDEWRSILPNWTFTKLHISLRCKKNNAQRNLETMKKPTQTFGTGRTCLARKTPHRVDAAGACSFPTLGNVNFTISVAWINSFSKVHNLKDFAHRDQFQNDCYHCTFSAANQTCKCEIGDSAKAISLPISRDLNHLDALAEKAFDYCLMTKSAFIRLVLSSVCLDLVMEGRLFGYAALFWDAVCIEWCIQTGVEEQSFVQFFFRSAACSKEKKKSGNENEYIHAFYSLTKAVA